MSDHKENFPSAASQESAGENRADFVEFERFLDCVHCGLCIPSCPTFLELGTEPDSPRGRIQLMRSLHEGRLELDDKAVLHLDGCLGCRACETACPSGVRYGELIEGARSFIADHHRRPFLERLKRRVINRVFPSPWWMRRFCRMVSILTLLRLNRLHRSSWLPSVVREVLRYLPDREERFRTWTAAAETPAAGSRRFRVGLLAGCVMQNLFGETQMSTVALLRQNGCDVHVPPGAGCCGALLLHNGEKDRGLALARRVIRAFDAQELDAVITNAAGCGAAMKDYVEHFKNDPELCEAAARVSGKIRDIAEFLADVPGIEPRRGIPGRVAYHDACHLLNGQGVRTQPRDLVRKIPGLELVELAETEVCCGSAGTYNLTEPELARRLGERKARHVLATGAETLIAGNPGCIIQIRAALRDRGSGVQVLHTADLLARAYTDPD